MMSDDNLQLVARKKGRFGALNTIKRSLAHWYHIFVFGWSIHTTTIIFFGIYYMNIICHFDRIEGYTSDTVAVNTTLDQLSFICILIAITVKKKWYLSSKDFIIHI